MPGDHINAPRTKKHKLSADSPLVWSTIQLSLNQHLQRRFVISEHQHIRHPRIADDFMGSVNTALFTT